MSSAPSSSSRRFSNSLATLLAALVATTPAYSAPKKKPPKPVPVPTPSGEPVPPSPAPAPTPAEPASQQKKEEAKARFDKAMTLFDRKIWDGALAEFLESRAAYPTRSNTQNAAICLRNLNRFDEALDMFETLVKEFPNLSEKDARAVEKEMEELRALVGTVEVRVNEAGAQITIDGRDRGQSPQPPIRVSVGTRMVRVFKEGFVPVEKRVEVAGKQAAAFDAKLEALGQSGRLSVSEDGGKPADVLVDNVVVGKAPWQGLVGIGEHVVFLRGEGNVGTQPANATVRTNQVTPIVLALEPLESALRVEPSPSGATVAIDGVVVGSGLWDGRLRRGRHKLEVAQNGFLPQERAIDLGAGRQERISLALERDPNSPLWRIEKPPRVFGEIVPSFPVGIVVGGDVASGGSASFPLGVVGRAHVGYELKTGIGFSFDAGYMYLARNVGDRDDVLVPVGKPEVRGVAQDSLSLRGLLVGASAHYHKGEKMPLLFRAGLGAFLANAADERTGEFPAGVGAPPGPVPTARTATDVAYLYVAPEVRIGYRVTDRIELSAGAEIMLMVALSEARWRTENGIVLGSQGLAGYPAQTFFGSTILSVNPGVGARFEF